MAADSATMRDPNGGRPRSAAPTVEVIRKGSEMRFTRGVINFSLAIMIALAPIVFAVRANAQQSDQASTALHEGRRLLKRGQADKALVQLRQALNLYTAAKNNSGMAATYNELGDLYLRQGQYQVALDNYQKALDGFVASGTGKEAVSAGVASAAIPNAAAATGASAAASAAVGDDRYNANLMLAKMGEVNYRLGKLAESQAAYSRMVVKKPEGAAAKAGRRFGGLSAITGAIPPAEWTWARLRAR